MYTEIYRDYAYHVYPICTTSRTKHLKKLQPHLTGLNHSALQQGNSENRCHMTPTQTMHYYNKNPWKLPYISNCLIPPTNGSHFITPGKSLWKKTSRKLWQKDFDQHIVRPIQGKSNLNQHPHFYYQNSSLKRKQPPQHLTSWNKKHKKPLRIGWFS